MYFLTKRGKILYLFAELHPTCDVRIADIEFHMAGDYCGYITAIASFRNKYAREITFRVFDPRCDKQLVLTTIDNGQLYPQINKSWNSIQRSLRDFCYIHKKELEVPLTFSMLCEPGEELPIKHGTWEIKMPIR